MSLTVTLRTYMRASHSCRVRSKLVLTLGDPGSNSGVVWIFPAQCFPRQDRLTPRDEKRFLE